MTNWILVPVRNNLHLTQAAMKTFLRQDLPEVRVLMIDNDSKDGTLEWARSLYPRIVIIRKYPPLSVAESWNKGLDLLFQDTPNQHVLVVNNDVELRFDTYRKLIEDGGDFVTAVGVNDRDQMATSDPSVKRPHPDFSCYLMRRHVWEKVGRFDENFKGAFCEDWDYHIRLQKAGISACCIDIPFYHVGSATINTMSPDDMHLMQDQAGLNRKYFKSKWGFEGASDEYYAQFKA